MMQTAEVRYGKMGFVGKCRTDREDLRPKDPVVLRTDRGRELATLLSPLRPIPEGTSKEPLFDVVRRASPDDVNAGEKIDADSRKRAMTHFREQVVRLRLEMKLVEADYLFGGERVIFYFKSDKRVDFRELVRTLVRELRTRVELRQVGARDEARLVGDCGHCGLKLCCRGVLKELGGITMDMAKVQKHTSDPNKITGRCGKLLCCLRYEYSAYREARDLMPQRGTMLETPKGTGRVVDQNLLLREVTIEAEGGQRHVVPLEQVAGVDDQRVAGCDGCATPKGGSEPPDKGIKVAEGDVDSDPSIAEDSPGGTVIDSEEHHPEGPDEHGPAPQPS